MEFPRITRTEQTIRRAMWRAIGIGLVSLGFVGLSAWEAADNPPAPLQPIWMQTGNDLPR